MPDGILILRFEHGTPHQECWTDGAFVTAQDAASPAAVHRRRIACLPDTLLAVQRAEVGQARSHRQRLQVAQLQLHNLFPDLPGGHRELLPAPGQEVLLVFLHPEGNAFLQTHAALLDTAQVWTTSCLLGFAAGRAAGLTHFCWPGDDGHWLVASPQAVTVAAGGEAEARARMRLLGTEEEFVILGWPDVMAALEADPPRFPLPDLALRRDRSAASAPWKPAVALALAVSLAGLLLLAAGLYRWRAAEVRRTAWEAATQRIYAAVLPSAEALQAEGLPAGLAPHAALERLVETRRGTDVDAIDLLRLLDQLSQYAPEDPAAMQLFRFHYAGGAGSMTLKVQQLNTVHAMLETIKQQHAHVDLKIEHVEKRPADMLVSISLRTES
ncbi:hypothetical protein [Megalodesulfovibrio gigas]|uniref:GspL periplasmic domain-containing protein n=1 Tax=Megalodesulfovibrio gigas (strain ATCC 19364 / DSM 1382 / NCIMB 9332 / VKM B-1759) TaxID=1121448 RepID=T2GGC0_MEGG1|nr:hypothetical protein [Megalodesulfovibrio gigas]AGW15261.1 hypothetical protein DGI_4049 [Megalodesulfovibrio gigas DSM 1382 = ATCC 19364]